MKKYLLSNLPFIITMLLFIIACAVVTMFTVKNEPQYVRVIPSEIDETSTVTSIAEQRININTATAEELQTLSGIGEVISERLIAYREEHGEFLYIEEIMEVQGIGKNIFENIKDFICVE